MVKFLYFLTNSIIPSPLFLMVVRPLSSLALIFSSGSWFFLTKAESESAKEVIGDTEFIISWVRMRIIFCQVSVSFKSNSGLIFWRETRFNSSPPILYLLTLAASWSISLPFFNSNNCCCPGTSLRKNVLKFLCVKSSANKFFSRDNPKILRASEFINLINLLESKANTPTPTCSITALKYRSCSSRFFITSLKCFDNWSSWKFNSSKSPWVLIFL